MGQINTKPKATTEPLARKAKSEPLARKAATEPLTDLLSSEKSIEIRKTRQKSNKKIYLTYIPEDDSGETLMERWENAFPKAYTMIADIPASIQIQSEKSSLSVKKHLEEIMRITSDAKRSKSSAFQLLFKRIYIVRLPITLSLAFVYEETHRFPHTKETWMYHRIQFPLQDGFTTHYLSKTEWRQPMNEKEFKTPVSNEPNTVYLNKHLLVEIEIKKEYKGNPRKS